MLINLLKKIKPSKILEKKKVKSLIKKLVLENIPTPINACYPLTMTQMVFTILHLNPSMNLLMERNQQYLVKD